MYSWLFVASCLVAPLRAATFTAGQSFQIVLSSPIDLTKTLTPDVSTYDVDVYDTPASTIAGLKAKGKTVICYFSAGTYENWRSDAAQFPKAAIGRALPDWPGEYWLNVSSPAVRSIMTTRINYAAAKGCDAIDPDNMDGYDNKNGLSLTQAQAVDYLKFMAAIAAAKGMKTGLKNSLAIIPSVSSVISFAVNEQCAQYAECDAYKPFLALGKPVFNIEYPSAAPTVSAAKLQKLCTNTGIKGMTTVLKDMDLDGWVKYCDSTTFTTALTDDDDEDDDEVTPIKATPTPTPTPTPSSTKKTTSTSSSTTMKTTTKSTSSSTTAKSTPTPTPRSRWGGRFGGRSGH